MMLTTNLLDLLDGYRPLSTYNYTSEASLLGLRQEGSKWLLDVDVPGYDKSEVSIFQEGEFVSIKAENKVRGCKSLQYRVSGVNLDSLEATLRNGVLYLSWDPAHSSKKVEIK
jgi:HSP20 family molecular chaperone IbpA